MAAATFIVGFVIGVAFTHWMKKSSSATAYREASKHCDRLATIPDWNIDVEIESLQREWEERGCLSDKAAKLLGELKFRKFLRRHE